MCSRRCSARVSVTAAKGVARTVQAGSYALFLVLDGRKQGKLGCASSPRHQGMLLPLQNC